MNAPEEATPARLHPIFFGSFDWHSCVHGWWQLLRLARTFPELGPEIYGRADSAFTTAKVRGELAYLERRPSFERPYGWGWLLALHAEASRHPSPWAESLSPLACLIASRLGEYLGRLNYPVRSGVHSNTAFALIHAYEWSTENDRALAETISSWAESRFSADRSAAHQEPSGEDFLSPTLVEALLMSRVLALPLFQAWFEKFLPDLPANLREPVAVSDRSDGRIGHLDGLNLSRAWCWRHLARNLPDLAEVCESAADRHLSAGLPYLDANYMSEHWLGSFALLAVSA